MSFLSDANDITSEAITPAQQTAWYNIIGQFEDKASQFLTARQDLNTMDTSQFDAQTASDYASLQSRAGTLQDTITTVQNALADVKSALAGAWSAVTGAWSSVVSSVTNVSTPDEINPATGLSPYAGLQGFGLGFLPLIPIAIVSAAVVALGYFLSDYATFAKKVALLRQGYTPAQIQQATKSSGGGLTASVGTLVWIAAGVAALIFLPKLIGQYKGAIRS